MAGEPPRHPSRVCPTLLPAGDLRPRPAAALAFTQGQPAPLWGAALACSGDGDFPARRGKSSPQQRRSPGKPGTPRSAELPIKKVGGWNIRCDRVLQQNLNKTMCMPTSGKAYLKSQQSKWLYGSAYLCKL
ncbi:uncharacterized protein [Lepidochelys kempii]|uniref:uncharacterized protein isoform X2 n=1 Tax=Lepidochelys kempii TaxID=8472 RepID=UPI003C700A43